MNFKKCPPIENKILTDDNYFEILTSAVFQSVIDPKAAQSRWPEIKTAFYDFNIRHIAAFDKKDIELLFINPKIIRNRKKIVATIENARTFQKIIEQHGSFENYLKTFSSKNEIINDLSPRIRYIGRPSIEWFVDCIQNQK